MKFGSVPLDEAEGALLAHSLRLTNRIIRKGCVLTASDLTDLRADKVTTVTVARLEPDDIHEDEAAGLIAQAASGKNLEQRRSVTGRANLHAAAAGILRVDATAIHAANSVDEALTLATPHDYTRLGKGQLAATAKVIPYAAKRSAVEAVCTALTSSAGALRLHPFMPFHAYLIVTQTPGMSDTMIKKGIDAVRRRVEALTGTLRSVVKISHDEAAIKSALETREIPASDLVLVLAASATADRLDVAPAGLVAAGGEVEHFGMPVDPGNLLVLAKIKDRPALILPGCVRSPALNGADWVLERFAARLPVTRDDIIAMGVGGLLKEIPSRPAPRERTVVPE